MKSKSSRRNKKEQEPTTTSKQHRIHPTRCEDNVHVYDHKEKTSEHTTNNPHDVINIPIILEAIDFTSTPQKIIPSDYEEEILKIIVILDEASNPYSTLSDQAVLRTNIQPPYLDEIIMQFGTKVSAYLHSMSYIFTFRVNIAKSDAAWIIFRRWMISCTLELNDLSYLDTSKRFQAGPLEVIQPILDRYMPMYLPALEPVLLLPALEEEATYDIEIDPKASSAQDH
ncbi:unnamed protein product [Vicia faba]|uniref:Uncharacterized protein n=1 Tax=Vicia faba TaxID=3906 RepID=A0AAV1ANR0_VICFA|nr:unnamed protein product [Vicia faba]